MDLNGKTAVITGAAGGIGLGIARACLKKGMQIVIADLDAGRVAETAAQLRDTGGDVTHIGCDVRSIEQVQQLRAEAVAAYGGVDLVCNNAGVGLSRPIAETTAADWELLIDVNIRGVVNGIQTFLPLMIEQRSGHINATSSMSGLVGDPGLVVYNATKFAVTGMMEALAQELAVEHPNLSASVLCPGPVATDLMSTSEKQLADAGSGATSNEAIAAYLAAGLSPDDVGQICIDGIRNGRFWLLTHPELTWEIMDPRYAAMKNGQLYSHSEAWTDQR
ncbi:MAG: SDR family NAD(P)-dependent oxidoreductase [Acidimicrobiales bacterium]|nr:SDR family NAD(P)-dependent oxidoreductase [Acidimicrobiales bacterium]